MFPRKDRNYNLIQLMLDNYYSKNTGKKVVVHSSPITKTFTFKGLDSFPTSTHITYEQVWNLTMGFMLSSFWKAYDKELFQALLSCRLCRAESRVKSSSVASSAFPVTPRCILILLRSMFPNFTIPSVTDLITFDVLMHWKRKSHTSHSRGFQLDGGPNPSFCGHRQRRNRSQLRYISNRSDVV